MIKASVQPQKLAPIPSLKAMVANASGIPVEQQRLIFRGKVLKDDQLLSDYCYWWDARTATLKPVNTCLTTMEKPPEDKMEATAESSKSAGTDRTTPKKRSKVAKPVVKDGKPHDSSSASQNSESISRGQQLLRSIVSQGSDGNRAIMNSISDPFPSTLNQRLGSMPSGGPGSREQVDVRDKMIQIIRGPSINNILTNLAEESEIDSPAALRNMTEQCTQSPAMMNTLNNMMQQVEGSQGGIDFSSMIRQIMPVVSQILAGFHPTPHQLVYPNLNHSLKVIV